MPLPSDDAFYLQIWLHVLSGIIAKRETDNPFASGVDLYEWITSFADEIYEAHQGQLKKAGFI